MKSRLCACGCGQITNIAPQNRKARGWIKGEPLTFIIHHNFRLSSSKHWRYAPTYRKKALKNLKEGRENPKIRAKNIQAVKELWKNEGFRAIQKRAITNWINKNKEKMRKVTTKWFLTDERKKLLKEDSNFSYCLGVLFGDGSLSRDTLEITVFEKAFAKVIYKTIRTSSLDIKINTKKIISNGFKKGQRGWRLRICSVQLNEWLLKITKNKTHIPSFIKYNPKMRRAFLSGFYDAEGWVSNGIYVGQKDKSFLSKIQKMLSLENISTSPFHIQKTPEYYKIYTIKSSWKKFSKLIGFKIPRKQKKLTSLINHKRKATRPIPEYNILNLK